MPKKIATAADIMGVMRTIPPHITDLEPGDIRMLKMLTAHLVKASPRSYAEYSRFLAIQHRGIHMSPDNYEWLDNKRILVTGGTGCIGSQLMQQIIGYGAPRELSSLSRGITEGYPTLDYSEYYVADITKPDELRHVFEEVRPQVVFHTAAQRDPGFAELEVHRTVDTNVCGTMNVINECRNHDAILVAASTGKALRPYSPDVYTASKRIAEWLLHCSAAFLPGVAASRFTHVVDNSILLKRLRLWCADGNAMRIHDPDIVFYAQSARESAQLLIQAGNHAFPGTLAINAITNLEMPVSLLDIALGAIITAQSSSPVYFSGYDNGYEGVPFPALYDPMTAGDASPLINMFEQRHSYQSPSSGTDTFLSGYADDPRAGKALIALQESLTGTKHEVYTALCELSWILMDATASAQSADVLERALHIAAPYRDTMNDVHHHMLSIIEHHVAEAAAVL
jgi:nucleoside-diphosphate-sugar epimerase